MPKKIKAEVLNLYYQSKATPKMPTIKFALYLDAQGLGRGVNGRRFYLGNDAISSNIGTLESGLFLREVLSKVIDLLKKDDKLGFTWNGVKEPINLISSLKSTPNLSLQDVSCFWGSTLKRRNNFILKLLEDFTTSKKVVENKAFASKENCQKTLTSIEGSLKTQTKYKTLKFEVKDYALSVQPNIKSKEPFEESFINELKGLAQTLLSDIKNKECSKSIEIPCYFLFDYLSDGSQLADNKFGIIHTNNPKNNAKEVENSVILPYLRESSVKIFNLSKLLPITGIFNVFDKGLFKKSYLDRQEKTFLTTYKQKKAEQIKALLTQSLSYYAKVLRDTYNESV
jgi:hypothetical protein